MSTLPKVRVEPTAPSVPAGWLAWPPPAHKLVAFLDGRNQERIASWNPILNTFTDHKRQPVSFLPIAWRPASTRETVFGKRKGGKA